MGAWSVIEARPVEESPSNRHWSQNAEKANPYLVGFGIRGPVRRVARFIWSGKHEMSPAFQGKNDEFAALCVLIHVNMVLRI
jgi:hypothetical protein